MNRKEIGSPNLSVVGGEVRPFPKVAGKNALREASGDDLRVLLCFLETGLEGLSDAAGVTPARTASALEYWVDAGILTETKAEPQVETAEPKKVLRKADELTPVGGEETADVIRRRNLSGMIEEAERMVGKMFNATEIGIMAGLCDQLELDPGYVLTLFGWCLKREKSSLRYLERTAFSLVSEGVSDIDTLEAYITRKEKAESGVEKIKRMFGVGERALTKKESALFERWTLEDKYPLDVIGIAYDITVNKTGKASAPYADKILQKWKENGVSGSVGEVETFLAKEEESRKSRPTSENAQSQKKKGAQDITSTFDTDEFFKKALERSYKK